MQSSACTYPIPLPQHPYERYQKLRLFGKLNKPQPHVNLSHLQTPAEPTATTPSTPAPIDSSNRQSTAHKEYPQ